MGIRINLPVLGLFAFAGASVAWAQAPDVAIVSAASTAATTAATINNDVRSKLLGTGLFNSVTILDVAVHAAYTPTLAELQAYDAVITWSNGTYFDATALGNVLADYVDAGGGVVVAVFANSTATVNRRLEGRWRTGGDYEIVRSGGGNTSGLASLGNVLVPNHPIMNGVTNFNGGTSSFRPTSMLLSPHGVKVTEWTDGRTLVAVSNQYARRADLGFYPASADSAATSWPTTTDGAKLLANALIYTIPTTGCYANCDASTVAPILNVNDFTCFLNIYAAGTTAANCDASTVVPILNVNDFTCFINRYAAGCT